MMMVEMKIVYQGKMHCELTHGPSNSKIETDAPRDNAGLGERFSPTDLVAAGLGSCILTTMAIMAGKDGMTQIDLTGMDAIVTKEMATTSPRKIARLRTVVQMPRGLSHENRKRLEAAAHGCPVHRSLGADVEAPIEFIYLD